MPVHNEDIAAVFDEIADLLEIEGAHPARTRPGCAPTGGIAQIAGRYASAIITREQTGNRRPLPGRRSCHFRLLRCVSGVCRLPSM